MHWFLGVDGGGSRTRLALIDHTGRVAAWVETGASNFHHADLAVVRETLKRGVADVCREAGVEPGAVRASFFGLAGVTSEPSRAVVRALAEAAGLSGGGVEVDHDIRVALAGGLAGRPGIALIVGTGSSCYGRDGQGRHWQTGGWGALIADEGSGYQLGREAIAAAARMADGRLPDSTLRTAVFAWLGIGDVSQIMHRLYEQELSRSEIAAFAPRVIELATDGDAEARRILEDGAHRLAEMVAANHRQLPTSPRPEVTITGGLGSAPTLYQDWIETAIVRAVPAANVSRPSLGPAQGAALLAAQAAGHPVTPAFVERLQAFHP